MHCIIIWPDQQSNHSRSETGAPSVVRSCVCDREDVHTVSETDKLYTPASSRSPRRGGSHLLVAAVTASSRDPFSNWISHRLQPSPAGARASMGYSADMFEQIRQLGLPARCRVMDIGSQDVGIGSAADLDTVNAFIRAFGGTALPANAPANGTIEAKEVYERAGFEYFRSDVDERPTTIYVDLNKLVFPAAMRDSVDLVVNVGTTEHLANPIGGFALMHYLAKPGGILYHDVPLFGFGNHGLTSPTPKFWHALIWMNAYERISSVVRRVDESSIDRGNFYHDYMSYLEGLDRAQNISWMIRMILRKVHARVFIPPYDAVLPESNGEKEANLIHGALYPFVRTGVWTDEEVASTIDEFVAMIGKPFRMGLTRRLLASSIGCARSLASGLRSRYSASQRSRSKGDSV
jgi:SAM-dependent methyltransferase